MRQNNGNIYIKSCWMNGGNRHRHVYTLFENKKKFNFSSTFNASDNRHVSAWGGNYIHNVTYIIGHDAIIQSRLRPSFSHHLRGVRSYSVRSTPNDRKKLFKAVLIYSQSFCQKSAERKSAKKYFSYFVLMSGLRFELWLFV